MKSSEVRKILKSKMPIEEKKRILDKEFAKPNTGKVIAGVAVATVLAAGITKLVSDKIKEKKLIKEIEEQEEAEFWDAYYENYDQDLEETAVEDELALEENSSEEEDAEKENEEE